MQSGQILLMRHAEKTDDPLDPDLSDKGLKRDERLLQYIPKEFGLPDFLFASALSKHSHRPYETIKPLSKDIGVPVDASFADQDYGALAQELGTKPHYQGKLILICWHHGNIPPLAHALDAKDGDYPNPWRREVFNLILKFVFNAGTPKAEQITEPF
jgi:broad specificity phosphatase PhoE